MQVLEFGRHLRKLRRGVHRANRFILVLRALTGERAALEQRLEKLRDAGFPNYFGEQRFGRNGSTLEQAQALDAWRTQDLARQAQPVFFRPACLCVQSTAGSARRERGLECGKAR